MKVSFSYTLSKGKSFVMSSNYLKYIILCIPIVFMLSGCIENDFDGDNSDFPVVFNIALPTSKDNPKLLFERMEPMRLYLERELHVRVEYYSTDSYSQVVKAMKDKKIDMAAFLPYPSLFTRENANGTAHEFNIIWVSETMPNIVYCLSKNLNQGFRKKVINAYVSIKKDTAAWGCLKYIITRYMVTRVPFNSLCYFQLDENVFNSLKK